MEAPSSAPKQISVIALLMPLVIVFLAAGVMGWQAHLAQQPVVIPELSAAANALKANNVEKARQQFEKFLAKGSDAPTLYEAVMAECSALGRNDLARYYGERAIQACRYAPNPQRALLYEALADAYSSGHEPPPQPRAIEYARRALELAPDDPNALNALGYILAENVQTEPEANIALGYLNRALSLLQGQVGTSRELLAQVEDSYGWALYKRGRFHSEDYAHAADALQQAVEDLPSNTAGNVQKILYYHLGAACRAAGRIEAARRALQVALVYDPGYADAKKELDALPQSRPPATTGTKLPASSMSVAPNSSAAAAPLQTSNKTPVFQPLKDDKSSK